MGLINFIRRWTARTENFSARAAGYTMKRNKVLKTVAIILVSVLLVLLVAVLGVFLYLRHLTSASPDTFPAVDDTLAQVTLTDAELDQLVRGEITLEELEAMIQANGAAEEAASSSTLKNISADLSSGEGTVDAAANASGMSEATSSSTGTAASSGSSASSGASSGTSSGAGSNGETGASTGSSGTSDTTEQPYEAEVKALLQQLYAIKAQAEAELNSCIAGAKAEYKALPESQKTQARKVSIALSRAGKLYAMQASYDKKVENVVNQMRAVLKANGQSTELADQAMAAYKAQKSAMYAQLTAKLYS